MNETTGEKWPCLANDTSTAVDNHNVLKAFFKGFPEFAKNDFWITGESYAGIYIPTLVEQVCVDLLGPALRRSFLCFRLTCGG